MVQPSDVLWIGGAQWAGKSTVAHLLTARYPIVRYVYDYHDARSHAERARDDAARFPAFSAFLSALDSDPSSVWVDPAPEQMAEQARAIFAERFEMVLDDLAALPGGTTTVLAEGWGLRPELVAPHLGSPRRAVFLVPNEPFRRRQLATLQRAQQLDVPFSDPERAQRNRVERDRMLGAGVREEAERLGLPVIEVDGAENETAVAERVESQFRPFLPEWLY